MWEPASARPEDAAALESEFQRAAPGAQVKLTLKEGVWTVRALASAAMCARGPEFADRDVSATIVEILEEHDLPARVLSRR